ncbi:hypothetical protein KDX38_11060 [Pseudomonas sp. CDFA 602]|uniref:hypothetical protein n=1 Tax=Pseudomonas californiensis TaxID=2829823 RepID=UPI001E650C7B|nr:hypothetical protein [Pseudomonas californiensis]MCD5994143.1 hypothetical protein [Pseudomonas californiensis]MCD5999758.1 hypothetical protein [Pseudomonas californiensis]
MAAGDLNGDLRDAYLTPEQRAAKVAGQRAAGPVGRATQQLANQPIAPPPTPAPASLADAAPKQTSFDITNTPVKSGEKSSLASFGAPPAIAAQQVQAPLTLAAAAPPSQSNTQNISADQYRTLSSGAGSPTAPIAARIGANGVPEFSNQPADLRSALNAAPIANPAVRATPSSLSDINPSAISGLGPGPSSYATGSLANLGDGIGVFSQANAGDGRLAMDRFARAANIRDAGRDKDRLDLASAKLVRDQNFNVVSDSSRRPTLADMRFDEQRQAVTQGLKDAVKGGQFQIDDRRQGQAEDQQLRQASRLDDLLQAATDPNATPAARAAYTAATDPTGEKALGRQLTQANIEKLGAEGRAADAKARNSSTGLDAQLKQLEIDKRQTDASTNAQALASQKVGALDVAKDAQKLVSEINGSGQLADITGTLDSKFPTFSNDSQDLINKANRLQTLLTADNLKLMTGVLTDRDITFLSQIGAGLGIGEKGINGSIEGTKQRLGEISTRLGEKISTYEKNLPAGQQQTAAPAPASTPAAAPVRVTSPADVAKLPSGTVFVAPDGSTRRKP